MKVKFIQFVILLMPLIGGSAVLFSQASDPDTKISGTVSDESGKPLAGANVVIEGTIDGAATDTTGYFEFETTKTGKVTLIFTAIDYREKQVRIEIQAGKPVEVNVRLTRGEVTTDEILVTASTYTSGQNSRVTLTALEVARIPGSEADIFRAISTFPG